MVMNFLLIGILHPMQLNQRCRQIILQHGIVLILSLQASELLGGLLVMLGFEISKPGCRYA